MDISGGKMLCMLNHQLPNVNRTTERGWRGSLNTFLVSSLSTKWIKKKIFSPQDAAKISMSFCCFKNDILSSSDADCTGVGAGAVAGMYGQKNWGSGGVGWIRDSLAWRELNRRGREGLGGQEGNQDWHT